MHLFRRRVLMTGPIAEVRAHALAVHAYVNGKLDQDVTLWSAGFGAPVGSLTFATQVDGLVGVTAMGAAFADDADYAALIEAGARFRAGPAIDALAEPIHGGGDGDTPPVGSLVMVNTAQIAPGKYADAFAWGVEVAQHVESVSGVPVGFMREVFGPFGQVTWMSIHQDAASADAAERAVNADEGYMKLLGDIGGLFVESSGHASMATRIA